MILWFWNKILKYGCTFYGSPGILVCFCQNVWFLWSIMEIKCFCYFWQYIWFPLIHHGHKMFCFALFLPYVWYLFCFVFDSIYHFCWSIMDIFSRGTRAQHLTPCGVCVVSVWCPLDGCDAPIGQRGKTTVQSQSVCTVQVYTQ